MKQDAIHAFIPVHDDRYAALAQREGELWGEEKSAFRTSWFDSPMIGRYINQCITGNIHQDWLQYVKGKYFAEPPKLGLNVGCGHGELERLVLKHKITEAMHGFDISSKAVEFAKENAAKAGLDNEVNYFVADANFLENSDLPAEYDAIFASMALHHFMQLEKCLDELNKRLKPGGLFITNEFTGPDRFQWRDRQLDAVNRFLKTIPLELRKNLRDPSILKEQVGRPSLEFMEEHFAFEAVCSERIAGALEERFEILEYKPYGGTILHLLFEAIMGNFEEEKNREHAFIVRAAIEFERALVDFGALQHDHVFFICKKKELKPVTDATL